jgi:hypothetical protein
VARSDDAGEPLNIGGDRVPDPNRRVLMTMFNGMPVFNTFPILYFDPGTQRVTDPDATAVPIKPPRLATPTPLRTQKRP